VFLIPVFPLFLLAGAVIEDLYTLLSQKRKLHRHTHLPEIFLYGLSILLIFFIVFSLAKTTSTSLIYPSDEYNNELAYVQQSPSMVRMIADIQAYIQEQDKPVKILITAGSYWPVPYYLKGHTIWYLTEPQPHSPELYREYDVIMADPNQLKDVPTNFEKREYETMKYVTHVLLLKTGAEELLAGNATAAAGPGMTSIEESR
jgi:hypothetical protein